MHSRLVQAGSEQLPIAGGSCGGSALRFFCMFVSHVYVLIHKQAINICLALAVKQWVSSKHTSAVFQSTHAHSHALLKLTQIVYMFSSAVFCCTFNKFRSNAQTNKLMSCYVLQICYITCLETRAVTWLATQLVT